MNKYLKHFRLISKHKLLVMYYCFKCGLYWQGLIHDNSKFSILEFFTSAKYYTGTVSPIDTEKKLKGYSLAWQHHKGRNPHHTEYWIDNIGATASQGKPPETIRIPEKYVYELICDIVVADIIYEKDKWSKESPKAYFKRVGETCHIHPETRDLIGILLDDISIYGVDRIFKNIKLKKYWYTYER